MQVDAVQQSLVREEPRRSYQVCRRCVMDTTDSKISFDQSGVCDHCRTFEEKIRPGWEQLRTNRTELERLIGSIRAAGRKRDFDCIIGMSGGIDSSFLTHLAVQKYGLRPLVFHVDAGWNSDEAVSNIERIVSKLNLDLYTEVIPWNEMRDLQLAYFRSGVPHIDSPQDHAFFATMYRFAAQHGIKHILTGGNFATECIRNPKEWMYYQSDSTQLIDIHNKFGSQKLKSFPTTSALWHKFYLPFVKGIKAIRLLDYAEYKKADAVALLKKEYDYREYPQKHFESRFTRFYEGYWLPRRFGFDTRRVQFSSLILTGEMSREEALERLTVPALTEQDALRESNFVASKLEISVEELQSYLELPLKSYRDFKSSDWLYNFGAKILRHLGSEKGGKR